MSTIRTLTMIAALTAGTVACHGKTADKAAADKAATDKAAAPAPAMAPGSADTPPPAAKELIPEADAQRFYTFIEQLTTIAVANQDDCVKLAAAIHAHIDANKAVVADAGAMMKQHKELPPSVNEKMNKKFKDELGPAVTKKCGKDPSVAESLRSLSGK
jgi:hypothetical protein